MKKKFSFFAKSPARSCKVVIKKRDSMPDRGAKKKRSKITNSSNARNNPCLPYPSIYSTVPKVSGTDLTRDC